MLKVKDTSMERQVPALSKYLCLLVYIHTNTCTYTCGKQMRATLPLHNSFAGGSAGKVSEKRQQCAGNKKTATKP